MSANQTSTTEWPESTSRASDQSRIATSPYPTESGSVWQEKSTTPTGVDTATASSSEAGLASTMTSSVPGPTTQRTTREPALDQNAIIAGAVFGVLLIGLILAGVCLARSRRRRAATAASDNAGSHKRRAKVPRPTPAGASVPGCQSNPYINPCFDATKEEMSEREHQAEEPAKTAQDSVNSIRNKEDHWIIPLADVPNDDTASNFDTTRF